MSEMCERLSQERQYYDEDGNPISLYRLVRQSPDWAASRLTADADHIAALEAERDYAALEYKREHALRLKIEAENERLRCALGTIAYDTSLSVPLGQEPGAHYRMMTHSCIITAVNALDGEVGE